MRYVFLALIFCAFSFADETILWQHWGKSHAGSFYGVNNAITTSNLNNLELKWNFTAASNKYQFY